MSMTVPTKRCPFNSPLLRKPAAILGLLQWRGPTAIAELVIPVVVLAVDGHSLGSLAHVGKEVSERQPTAADCDASATIVKPSVVLDISHAGQHLSPRGVGSVAARTPMFRVPFTCPFRGDRKSTRL